MRSIAPQDWGKGLRNKQSQDDEQRPGRAFGHDGATPNARSGLLLVWRLP
uniref:Uncharacterized protein n=1 Tax=Enterovibrio norvegicus TaxID=188144 RepID=A0A0H4A506_9GAMM|nr:hypothetical protein [Enterovibrio norvegicus]